ncbi:IclR family transcriptional regulator [Marihabitans asiaticum]|uniref:Glycerol operon regulatory protein n=1 Tax=Marihabitans asiaticum TaxID=415218 RepID=A0A560WD85_9MICO|nr:IclR family transcriptional regulator [Marihabitans asiaticum]
MPRVASTPRRSAPQTDALRSVRIALDVLECFATDEQLGVTDVATKIGVAKSTAHRMLSVLVDRGYTEHVEGSSQYRLGMHIYELGQLAQGRHQLRYSALPLMYAVQAATGLIVNLSVPEGGDVVFVERLEQPGLGHLVEHLGRRLPAHTTSSGKAIAAFNPCFGEARRVAGFPPRVSRTVRSSADWERELTFVRRNGFARSVSESVDDLATVAVPILNIAGMAVAAMSVMGPTERVTTDIERLAQVLRLESRRLQPQL